MSFNKNIPRLILIPVLMLLLVGCYKNKTVLFDTGAEVTKTVSFASDIIPIFNNSCNSTGCHTPGGKSPDLSVANAFNALTGGNYIDREDAASSNLYLWMTGKKAAPMPLSGINKDYNALVLAWIKQGGQNN